MQIKRSRDAREIRDLDARARDQDRPREAVGVAGRHAPARTVGCSVRSPRPTSRPRWKSAGGPLLDKEAHPAAGPHPDDRCAHRHRRPAPRRRGVRPGERHRGLTLVSADPAPSASCGRGRVFPCLIKSELWPYVDHNSALIKGCRARQDHLGAEVSFVHIARTARRPQIRGNDRGRGAEIHRSIPRLSLRPNRRYAQGHPEVVHIPFWRVGPAALSLLRQHQARGTFPINLAAGFRNCRTPRVRMCDMKYLWSGGQRVHDACERGAPQRERF